ncbi:hypothetical protein BST81_15535 [Leptolyngbya sp. 'hensonii']|uniref:hypothetical protein n=1 Tax=Leptolyngbya sp. 'hensonii' TaxID=1922337 RepID=UPI00094F5352|nr:hypothetical protein [Leptolyngbya sp. 'hensonii']OLP17729.1 hypothetical protein BST81_15535 [Leptolyngbya sp. 'hensonii']
MALNLLDHIGDWNPQLFRELKGRLQSRNLLLTLGGSLLGQTLTLLYYWNEVSNDSYRYCLRLGVDGQQMACNGEGVANLERLINWSFWWQDIFFFISLVGLFVLSIGGIYLLVSDLDWEHRRGTLNFIRLSPQSASKVLVGKLLGVPILLYLTAILAVPLHLWAGFSAGIPIGQILGFYAVLIGCCAFFYSAALLWGLTSTWLGGFQAWLSAGLLGMLFLLLCGDSGFASQNQVLNYGFALLCPAALFPHFNQVFSVNHTSSLPPGFENLSHWQFFYAPLGSSFLGTACFMLLSYGLWTYWCWQGLERCFHHPGAPVLSKGQSYGLVACFNLFLLGFAVQDYTLNDRYAYDIQHTSNTLGLIATWVLKNYQQIFLLNLVLFLGLALALSPQRQSIIDWARYRREQGETGKTSLWQDLVWGEKSPAVLTIGLGTLIMGLILAPWILLGTNAAFPKASALLSLGLNTLVWLVYGTIAQLLLLLRSPKRSMWATINLSLLLVLPSMVLAILSMEPEFSPQWWLLTGFHWIALEHGVLSGFVFSLLAQCSALVLLNLKLIRQINHLGASATQTLLADRKALVAGR